MGPDKLDRRRNALYTIILIVVILTGLGLRLALVYHDRATAGQFGDEPHYESIGRSLVEGHGYRIQPVPDQPPRLSALRTPIAPLLVSLVYLAGPHKPIRAEIAWAFMDMINVLLVFHLGMMVTRNRPASLIAAAMYAFHPYIVRSGSRILSEIPFNIMYLSALMLLVSYWRSKSVKQLCFSALFLGLSILTRPSTVLFPALVMLLLFLDGRREKAPWLGRAFLYCVITGLVILPWTIRCSLAFKHFIPISTAGGYPLWSGAGPGPHGEIVICPPYVPEVNNKILKMDEIQADRFLTQEAKKLIRARPMHWLYLDMTKFFTLWFRLFRDGSMSMSGLLTTFGNLAILILAWFGVRVSGDRRLVNLLIGMFVYFSVIHMTTYAELRYVIGAYSYMMPFAGLAIVHMLNAVQTRIRPRTR